MVGITSYGAYIPLHRLNRGLMAEAWGGFPTPGERSVANFDEDTVTMGVAAGIDCMNGIDRSSVDGLFFATTTSPYLEKQIATIAAWALDLRADILTADITNSLRSGTTALSLAADGIKSGSLKKAMVIASDQRMGAGRGNMEQLLGDGAGALLLGDKGVIASIEGSYSLCNELIDVWRTNKDDFVRSWEDRFIRERGYGEIVAQVVREVLKKCNLTPKDIAKAAFYGPTERDHAAMARSLGLDPATQVQNPLLRTVGDTGTALPFMVLVAALEEAKPGDRILFASYGNGGDAFVLQVTEEIEKVRDRRGIKCHLETKKMIPSYMKYVRLRQLMPEEAAARTPTPPVSASALWRESREILALNGGRCKQCGTINIPPQRVCVVCRAKDQYEMARMSDKKAKIFTFTADNLESSVDPPTIHTVVDFDGGNARCLFEMTDREPNEVQIGMPVEMTFRKLYEVNSIHNYFWKTRPVRC